ncbi:hypothetical protein BTVI_23623 [Pitangus sulphuratus]|nr:hypothetical protein BTVI_23623 [Pitangus sulphuratus]
MEIKAELLVSDESPTHTKKEHFLYVFGFVYPGIFLPDFSIIKERKEVIVLLTLSTVCSTFGHHSIEKALNLLESVQRRAMKVVKSLEGKLYEEWPRSLDLFSLERRSRRGDLTVVFNILIRRSRGAGTNHFTLMTSDRNGLELSQGRFR